MKKISICCLCHNDQKWVQKSIQSIWDQKDSNLEILVLDDGSIDATFAILEDLVKKSPVPMQVFTQKNTANVGKNWNFLFQKASGDFVIFWCMDDLLCENAIANLRFVMDQHENEIELVSGTILTHIDENEKILETKIIEAAPEPQLEKSWIEKEKIDFLLEKEREGGSFWNQGSLYKKTLLDQIGGFEENMRGDDIVLRIKILQHLKKANQKMLFIKKPIFLYRIHGNNLHKNRERQLEILYQVVQRFFPDQKSKTLQNWLESAILHYFVALDFKNAFRLLFWDEKNQNKLETFFKMIFFIIQKTWKKIKQHLA